MIVFLLFALFLLAIASGQSASMGPVGRIDIKKVEECRNFNGPVKLQFGKDSQGRRAFNARVKLKEDFTNLYTFKVNVHEWNGSMFNRDIMIYEGKICEFANKYMKQIRETVYQLANVRGACDVKAGNYVAKGIYAEESQLDVPGIINGTFQVELKLHTPRKELIGCYIIDVDSMPKD